MMTDYSTDDTSSDTDHASTRDQFAPGDTIVKCFAGSRAVTGKTTRLIEWFREQHGDEAVLTLLDPKGDPNTQAVEIVRINPLSATPRQTTHKYSVSGERSTAPDDEEGAP